MLPRRSSSNGGSILNLEVALSVTLDIWAHGHVEVWAASKVTLVQGVVLAWRVLVRAVGLVELVAIV